MIPRARACAARDVKATAMSTAKRGVREAAAAAIQHLTMAARDSTDTAA